MKSLSSANGGGGRYTFDDLYNSLEGWFGYAMWADTYKFRKKIMKKVKYLESLKSGNIP